MASNLPYLLGRSATTPAAMAYSREDNDPRLSSRCDSRLLEELSRLKKRRNSSSEEEDGWATSKRICTEENMASHMQQLCIATSPPNLPPSYCLTPPHSARESDGSRAFKDTQYPLVSSSTLHWTQPLCNFIPQQQGDVFCAPSSVGRLHFEFTHHLNGRTDLQASETGLGSGGVGPTLSNRPMVAESVALFKQEEDSYSEEEEEEEDEAHGVKVEDVSEDSSDDNNSSSTRVWIAPEVKTVISSFQNNTHWILKEMSKKKPCMELVPYIDHLQGPTHAVWNSNKTLTSETEVQTSETENSTGETQNTAVDDLGVSEEREERRPLKCSPWDTSSTEDELCDYEEDGDMESMDI